MFSRLASVVGWIALFFGLLHLVIGFGVASGYLDEGIMRRYAAADSAPKLIDRALVTLLVGIALGTLGEIGRAVKRAR